ncbi:MAG: J domain-containing protein [Dermatophilaceae bacterium]
MDAPLNPYRELGVPRAASKADITNAYHHLVRLHHPDSRPAAAHDADSETALNRIMAAYTILEDPDRRYHYDRQHPEPSPQSHQHPPSPLTWIGRRPPDSLRVTAVRWH